MDVETYRQNRASFPLAELDNYRGQWVAFSLDGRRIIAGGEDLGELNKLIINAGEDPEEVALERIEADDVFLGGAELS